MSRCTAWVESPARDGVRRRAAQVKQGRELFVVRRFLGPGPRAAIEIVSARRSGQDVAEEMRKEQKFGSETQKFRSPFHPDSRPLYMFFRDRRAGDEPIRLSFHPTYQHRKDAGLFEGTALFDRASGRLLEWTAYLVNPPTFVTKAEVTREVCRPGGGARRPLRGERGDRGRAALLQAARPDGLPLQRLQLPGVDAAAGRAEGRRAAGTARPTSAPRPTGAPERSGCLLPSAPDVPPSTPGAGFHSGRMNPDAG